MITVRVPHPHPHIKFKSIQSARAMAIKQLKPLEAVVRKSIQEKKKRARELLAQRGIEYFEKKSQWVFTAESGEKVSLPPGWYTRQNGILHQIQILYENE